ncbi:MAG: prepilin peptidase [bacterium]|nr:prepilin peptidase [bacterium]
MFALFFFVIGAALGSFSLVLAWRYHDGKDWVGGRSECDKCHKTLSSNDLIPVISWLSLKGKCRYCKKPISSQVFVAELGLGVVAGLSYYFWPHELISAWAWLHFGVWLIILTVMSALFWHDYRWQQLPTRFMEVLIGLAAVEALLELIVKNNLSLIGILAAVGGALTCGGFFWLIYKISRGRWIGDGDAMLGLGLGLIAGSPLGAFILIFMSSIIGTLVSFPLLLSSRLKMKSRIAYGPLLIVSVIIVQLFSERLINWYLSLIGL